MRPTRLLAVLHDDGCACSSSLFFSRVPPSLSFLLLRALVGVCSIVLLGCCSLLLVLSTAVDRRKGMFFV